MFNRHILWARPTVQCWCIAKKFFSDCWEDFGNYGGATMEGRFLDFSVTVYVSTFKVVLTIPFQQ